MAEFARERGGTLIVDEIYHGLVYEGDYTTALAFADDVFVINSFSKYFNMTGWRLGLDGRAGALRRGDRQARPEHLPRAARRRRSTRRSRRSSRRRSRYWRPGAPSSRRGATTWCRRCAEIGFDIPVTPQGAFYVYAGCGGLTRDSFGFARDLLEEAGVAITPGVDFGANAPERHVRFAYTNSIERLKEGVRRIAAFLERRNRARPEPGND